MPIKTLGEWLEELPVEVRVKAIVNTWAQDGTQEVLDVPESDLYNALSGAFKWDETPEGHEYWSALAHAAKLQSRGILYAEEVNENT